MPRITVVIAALLIGLGLVGYFGAASEDPSPTTLIPAGVGLLLAVTGVLGFNSSIRKHAMHAAAMVSTIGALAALGRGMMSIGKLFSDVPDEEKRPVKFVLVMFVLCAVHVFLCVQSFRQARRNRQQAA